MLGLFVSGLFHAVPSRLIHAVAHAGFPSFLRLNNIPLYIQATFVHPFVH